MPVKGKAKRGRPATGRDPLFSIRVPVELLSRIQKMQQSLRRENDRITVSDIVREAISLGLDSISGEKPSRGEYLPPGLRPEHRAEIHEAGHAVVAFLFGDDVNVIPDAWVKKVVLKRQGAGVTHLGPAFLECASAKDFLKMDVAGAVADSLHEGLPFWDRWNSAPCRSDKRSAAKKGFTDRSDIEDAASEVRRDFEKPAIWAGLLYLARGLTYESRTGSQCWNDFVYGRDNLDRLEKPVTPP